MKIYLKELQEIKQRIKEINKEDLWDIVLLDEEGKLIEMSEENIREWKFIGLTNFEFLLAEGKFTEE